MKLHLGRLGLVLGLAAAGAIAFGGAVFAQNVPAQYVVSGKAAEKIQDFTTINLATAERIAESCEKAATAQGVQISIMVLDHDGNHVYFDRMDGQGYLNIITADMKARTALMTRAPSKLVMNRVIQDPNAELQLIQLGEFANSGGLPIVANKQLIGVVGVGGSAPRPPVWSDEICGHKGLEEVFGPSVAPLVEDLPPRQNANPGSAPVPRFAAANPPKTALPSEYVVGGKGAGNVFDGNQISLAAAKKIARVCRDWAASKNGTASIYILDNAGEFVHMERMDGQVFNNIRTALLKAQSSLKTRQPTSMANAQLKNNPAGIARQATYFNLFTNSGGIPIVVDGQMIGSVGVGGGAGGGDENCAIEGLKATFGEHVTLPVYPPAAAGTGGQG
jgi:glc operon protein GlcG